MQIANKWKVVVGTRGGIVLLVTFFIAVWVTNPWGWCEGAEEVEVSTMGLHGRNSGTQMVRMLLVIADETRGGI